MLFEPDFGIGIDCTSCSNQNSETTELPQLTYFNWDIPVISLSKLELHNRATPDRQVRRIGHEITFSFFFYHNAIWLSLTGLVSLVDHLRNYFLPLFYCDALLFSLEGFDFFFSFLFLLSLIISLNKPESYNEVTFFLFFFRFFFLSRYNAIPSRLLFFFSFAFFISYYRLKRTVLRDYKTRVRWRDRGKEKK